MITKEEFKQKRIALIEIFNSVSGEGISAGEIVTFVRVAGCNLRCTWCDTKYSFKTSGKGVVELAPDEIVAKLNEIGCKTIISTGGEPMEDDKIKRYLPLYLNSLGFNTRIETSGHSSLYTEIELSSYLDGDSKRPSYTMDVKCPDSNIEESPLLQSNMNRLLPGDELKFVAASYGDLNYALLVIKRYKNLLSENKIAINFSPVFGLMEAKEIVSFMQDNHSWFVSHNLIARLSLQIHKYIWNPDKRGV